MKDLTIIEKEKLLAEVKSFLDITWDDDDTDKEIWRNICTSIKYLDDVVGVELDYIIDELEGEEIYLSLCSEAYDLMKARVYYMREKALDDFEKNYQSDLVRLYLKGRAYASTL